MPMRLESLLSQFVMKLLTWKTLKRKDERKKGYVAIYIVSRC